MVSDSFGETAEPASDEAMAFGAVVTAVKEPVFHATGQVSHGSVLVGDGPRTDIRLAASRFASSPKISSFRSVMTRSMRTRRESMKFRSCFEVAFSKSKMNARFRSKRSGVFIVRYMSRVVMAH